MDTAGESDAFASIDTYADTERQLHQRRTTRTSFHIPKSRRRYRVNRRGPVRDSKRAYRAGLAMLTRRLADFRELVKGQHYTGPAAIRVVKADDERASEPPVDLLAEDEPREPVNASTDCEFYLPELPDRSDNQSAVPLRLLSAGSLSVGISRGQISEQCSSAGFEMVDSQGEPYRAPSYHYFPRAANEYDPSVIDLASSPSETDLVGDNAENANRELGGFECAVCGCQEEDDDGATYSEVVVSWPCNIHRLRHQENPEGIKFSDEGSVHWCGCSGCCEPYFCPNAIAGLFCAANNCLVGAYCGNRPREMAYGLELRQSNTGVGVFAERYIPAGTILGQYAGVLTTHDYDEDAVRISDYVLKMRKKSTKAETVYIEALHRGAMSRFINHSCNPKCHFFEVYNRREVAVVVFSVKEIAPDEEVTVDYGELWFKCRCGSDNCRGGIAEE